MKTTILKGLTISLILASSVVFTACSSGDKTETDSGNNSEVNSGAVEEDETTETQPSITPASSFNFYGIATGKTNEEFNDSSIAKLLETETGYKVTYDQSPADANDALTAITNIFLTKEDYQAVVVTKNQFYSLLAQDALYDVTDLVNGTENLKNEISELGWSSASKDGKIYGLPQKNATVASDTAIAFRVDWLNEYNEANPDKAISIPSEDNGYTMTTTEFKEMLSYFKGKVPAGGAAMSVDMNGVFLDGILPAFGVYNEWAEVDGQLEYYINQPGFENYLAYMQELFDAGLISYQATANDANTVKQLQAKNVGVGRVPHWNAVTIEKTDTQEVDENIGYIRVLVPDDAKGDTSKVRMMAKDGYSYYTVIPKFATPEQATAVVDWADKKLNKDLFAKMTIGTEGNTFEIKDGEYYPINPAFDEQQGLSDKYLTGTREEDYAQMWLARTRKTEAQDKIFSVIAHDMKNTAILSPVMVMPPNDTYDNYFTGADLEVKTQLITAIYQTGNRPTLQDVQAVWEANYGNDIDVAVNEWYSTWELKEQFNPVKPR